MLEMEVPPRSPVLRVLLNILVQCKGWWISPTRCERYRAIKARSKVTPCLFVFRTVRQLPTMLMEFTSLWQSVMALNMCCGSQAILVKWQLSKNFTLFDLMSSAQTEAYTKVSLFPSVRPLKASISSVKLCKASVAFSCSRRSWATWATTMCPSYHQANDWVTRRAKTNSWTISHRLFDY